MNEKISIIQCVSNIMHYTNGIADRWCPLYNPGIPVYVDDSVNLPPSVTLSMSPLNDTGMQNVLAGRISDNEWGDIPDIGVWPKKAKALETTVLAVCIEQLMQSVIIIALIKGDLIIIPQCQISDHNGVTGMIGIVCQVTPYYISVDTKKGVLVFTPEELRTALRVESPNSNRLE